MAGGFAGGFIGGLGAGVEFGQALLEGRQAKGIGDATEILAEMQNMTPGFSQAAAIPDGEGNGQGPATGYSGEAWNSMKTRYIEAMKNVTDPRVLDAMMDQMADMEKGKVMEYGRMAMAAMDNGDMESAQNYLSGISYFTDPGTTPTINVTPDGKVLMGGDGVKPMVLTKPQLEDFLHQYTNFEGYRDLAFDKEKHQDMMDHREKQRLDAAADAAARRAIAREELDARKEVWAQDSAYDQARIAALEQEMEHADANFKAGASKAAQERVDKITSDAQDFIESYLEDPGTVSDTNKGSGGGDDLGLGIVEEGPELTDAQKELIADAEGFTAVSDADTVANTAAVRARNANARRVLSNPATQLDFQNLVLGLASGSVYTEAGEQKSNMTGQQAASIALRTILSDGSDYDVLYDQDNGQLVVMHPPGPNGRSSPPDRYKIGPAYQGMIGAMIDPLITSDEVQGPNPPPQEQAIPEG